MKKESIKFTVKATDRRNEMHFETQLKNRAVIFQDKKKKCKNGYVKHKNKEYDGE